MCRDFLVSLHLPSRLLPFSFICFSSTFYSVCQFSIILQRFCLYSFFFFVAWHVVFSSVVSYPSADCVLVQSQLFWYFCRRFPILNYVGCCLVSPFFLCIWYYNPVSFFHRIPATLSGENERIDELIEFIRKNKFCTLEYDDKFVRKIIQSVTVYEEQFVLALKSGIEIEI